MNICINIDVLAFFAISPFGQPLVCHRTRCLVFFVFCSLLLIDGSDVIDAVLPKGLSVSAPPLSCGTVESGSSATTARTFAELKSFLSNELCSFREELKRQNDERWSISQAVKKIRLENSARHSFKSKGNEQQYNHQEKVPTFFDSVIQPLHSGKPLEVRNVLEEDKNFVATRSKICTVENDSDEERIRKVLKKSKGEEKGGKG